MLDANRRLSLEDQPEPLPRAERVDEPRPLLRVGVHISHFEAVRKGLPEFGLRVIEVDHMALPEADRELLAAMLRTWQAQTSHSLVWDLWAPFAYDQTFGLTTDGLLAFLRAVKDRRDRWLEERRRNEAAMAADARPTHRWYDPRRFF